jgi:16S rRNA (guanine1207-N2)-methyltransferase
VSDVLTLLERAPDVEAPELVAVDATDRLLLDTAADLIAAAAPGEVAVVDDGYGALAGRGRAARRPGRPRRAGPPGR